MQTIRSDLKEKIDRVIPPNDSEKMNAYVRVKLRFDALHQLLSQLPEQERDKVSKVLSAELLALGIAFSNEIADRLTADEKRATDAIQNPREQVSALSEVFRKQISLLIWGHLRRV